MTKINFINNLLRQIRLNRTSVVHGSLNVVGWILTNYDYFKNHFTAVQDPEKIADGHVANICGKKLIVSPDIGGYTIRLLDKNAKAYRVFDFSQFI